MMTENGYTTLISDLFCFLSRRLCKFQDLESEALWEVIKSRAVERYQIGHKLAQLETQFYSSDRLPTHVANALNTVR